MFIFIYLSNNEPSVAAISSHTAWSIPSFTISYSSKNNAKEIANFFKNVISHALDFLPPRKPGLYISHVYFFFEYHEFTK